VVDVGHPARAKRAQDLVSAAEERVGRKFDHDWMRIVTGGECPGKRPARRLRYNAFPEVHR
jgi:hypothetical protein